MKIGIIGFGRFGQLAYRYLAEGFEVCVFDKISVKYPGVKLAPLNEVCSSDIMILCVPISEFKNTLLDVKDLIKKNALIIDVCSVKEYPVRLMKKILPKNVQILATHPMFGPDSAAKSLKGRKIVLCKVRISKKNYEKIKKNLKKKGIITIETTPSNHDKEIANSLLLTHVIGRSMMDFGAKDMKIDTEGYKKLLMILDTVKNDSWQLFRDMNLYNKHSKKMKLGFMNSVKKISKMVEK